MPQVFPDRPLRSRTPARCVVGMHADGSVHEIVTADQPEYLLLIGFLLTGIRHQHKPLAAGLAVSLNYIFNILVKPLAGDVTVCVK